MIKIISPGLHLVSSMRSGTNALEIPSDVQLSTHLFSKVPLCERGDETDLNEETDDRLAGREYD